jgi:hypothetical protein
MRRRQESLPEKVKAVAANSVNTVFSLGNTVFGKARTAARLAAAGGLEQFWRRTFSKQVMPTDRLLGVWTCTLTQARAGDEDRVKGNLFVSSVALYFASDHPVADGTLCLLYLPYGQFTRFTPPLVPGAGNVPPAVLYLVLNTGPPPQPGSASRNKAIAVCMARQKISFSHFMDFVGMSATVDSAIASFSGATVVGVPVSQFR